MSIFLQDKTNSASNFSNNFCYSYKYDSKYLIIYVYFIITHLKNTYESLVKGLTMIILTKLLEQSLKSRPNMPIEYHLETLRIASRLIGGKR